MPLLITAFVAGLVSFLSPCVIPLLSTYVAFLSGHSADQDNPHRGVLRPALSFIMGFTLVFTALGSFASAAGVLMVRYAQWVNWIAGLIVITMGLQLVGAIHLAWPSRRRMVLPRPTNGFWLGVSFAAVWTPCTGPILASILLVAATQGALGYGTLLLLTYSLGLAVPFLVTAWMWNRWSPVGKGWGRFGYVLSKLAGVFIIVMGILIITGQMTRLIAYLS